MVGISKLTTLSWIVAFKMSVVVDVVVILVVFDQISDILTGEHVSLV